MEKRERLVALDGLRGFAILLVFLNHINSQLIIVNSPSFLLPFLKALFGSGGVAVHFLFLLSGFLLFYTNPQPKFWPFLQKRYSRLLPLYASICFTLFIFNLLPNLIWYLKLFIFVVVTWLSSRLMFMVDKQKRTDLKKGIFIGFLTLQAITALMTLGNFWFFLPLAVKTFLVNLTLTFPLTKSITLLDGAWWFLATEFLFSALYPLVRVLSPPKRRAKPFVQTLLIFSCFPLLFFLAKIINPVANLGILQIHLFIYFLAGILLAERFEGLSPFLRTKPFEKVSLLLFFLVIFLINYLFKVKSLDSRLIKQLFDVLPLSLMMILVLDKKSSLNHFLNGKIWLYLGSISYPLYLSHNLIINISRQLYQPTGAFSNFVWISLTLLISVVFARRLQIWFYEEKTVTN